MENAYLVPIQKRLRALRKKLERIVVVETQQASGKQLQEEQRVLLSSKPHIVAALHDMEALRSQMEAIALSQTSSAAASASEPAPEPVCEPSAPEPFEEPIPEPEPIPAPPSFTDVANDPILVIPEPVQPAISEEYLANMLHFQSFCLLELLQVHTHYSAVTGNALPAEIEFLGQALLGLGAPEIDTGLHNALYLATLYCNVSLRHPSNSAVNVN